MELDSSINEKIMCKTYLGKTKFDILPFLILPKWSLPLKLSMSPFSDTVMSISPLQNIYPLSFSLTPMFIANQILT